MSRNLFNSNLLKPIYSGEQRVSNVHISEQKMPRLPENPINLDISEHKDIYDQQCQFSTILPPNIYFDEDDFREANNKFENDY